MRRSKLALVTLLIILVLGLMSGCGEEKLELGKATVFDGFAEITPINVLVDDYEVFPPKDKEGSRSFVAENKSVMTVIAVMKVKNLTDGKLSIDDLGRAAVSQGEEEYSTYDTMLLTDKGTTLKHGSDIAKGKEGIVYFLIDVSADTLGEATINFVFNDESDYATLECDTSQTVAVRENLEMGKPVTAEGYAKITLKSADYSKRVVASKVDKNSEYDYYPPRDGKTYIDLQVAVKNLGKKAIPGNEFVGAIAAIDQKVYRGFAAVENAQGTDLANYASIKPGETRIVHIIISVPKKMENVVGQAYYIDFNDKKYVYGLN